MLKADAWVLHPCPAATYVIETGSKKKVNDFLCKLAFPQFSTFVIGIVATLNDEFHIGYDDSFNFYKLESNSLDSAQDLSESPG